MASIGNFHCDLCDITLSRKDKLIRHKRIHNGVRFSCSECDSKYSRKDKLTAHLKIKHRSVKTKHSEMKASTKKNSGASTKQTLVCKLVKSRKKKVVQMKTTNFNCSECDGKYSRKDKLTAHVKAKHPKFLKKLKSISKPINKSSAKKEDGANNKKTFINKHKPLKRKSSKAQHNGDEAAIYIHKCDQCASKFKAWKTCMKHKHFKHFTDDAYAKVETNIKECYTSGRLEIDANLKNFEEFIIDALYSNEGRLICRGGDSECFSTDNALEMKAHRERYHALLELRFPFDKWKHLVPELHLVDCDIGAEIKRHNVSIDVIEILQNVKLEYGKSKENIKDIRIGVGEDSIRKDFSDYLAKLRCRRAGH